MGDEMKTEMKTENDSLLTDSEEEKFKNEVIGSSDEEEKPKKKRRPRKMRKIVQRENFGDENEVPFGLGYIKEIEKEPETKKTKRQSLKVENEISGDKSVEVKHEKVKNTRSNKVKLEETQNENESDGS